MFSQMIAPHDWELIAQVAALLVTIVIALRGVAMLDAIELEDQREPAKEKKW